MFVSAAAAGVHAAPAQTASPIKHVVIIDQENHSFDDMLGKFCREVASGAITRTGSDSSCDGTDVGVLPTGARYGLTQEPDFGLNIDHSVGGQKQAIDGGRMDGFARLNGCRASDRPAYGCLTQFDALSGTCGVHGSATCIPNAVALAENFAISDRTFEFAATPSWAGHMILGSATMESFVGQNPSANPLGTNPSPGWGCDSGRTTAWQVVPSKIIQVPSCIPDRTGSMGPIWEGTKYVRQAHASYVPTIFDRMDAAGLNWRIYGGSGGPGGGEGGYGWTICPTFWECLGSSQDRNLVPNSDIFTDAASGNLPAVSFVTPEQAYSEHQPASVSQGDTWVGSVISALMNSPDWPSTAVFLTWDDCGCFYDHVNPLQYDPEWGVRVSLIIVSPYAKPGYTDSTPATFVSLLAFVEHTFGLQPLGPCAILGAHDSNCTDDVQGLNHQPTYDYSGAFTFSDARSRTVPMTTTTIPSSERAWLAAHPHAGGGRLRPADQAPGQHP